jgi:hypothetical protein
MARFSGKRTYKTKTYFEVCPRSNHSHVLVIVAECRRALNELTKELAVKLGPGTESLMMRYGLILPILVYQARL